jgi:hypothetical protein
MGLGHERLDVYAIHEEASGDEVSRNHSDTDSDTDSDGDSDSDTEGTMTPQNAIQA